MIFRRRKPFPVEVLQASGGEIGGTISYNSMTDKKPALRYHMHINLVPFRLQAMQQDTAVRLFSLPLPHRSWRHLAHQQHTFPADPPMIMVDGEPMPGGRYAPGTISLLGQHLSLHSTSITFGQLEGDQLEVSVDLNLELEKINYRPAVVTLKTRLTIASIRVLGDVALLKRPTLEEARQLGQQFLHLDDYAPQLVGGVVSYEPVMPPQ